MSHHKGGFEPETNGFQFYAIANLDKTSLLGYYRDSESRCLVCSLGPNCARRQRAGVQVGARAGPRDASK